MRIVADDRLGNWIRGAFVIVVASLAAVVVPGALSWAIVVAVGLVGVTLATVALVRSRRTPSLAQVISDAQSEVGRPEGGPLPVPGLPGSWMPSARSEISRSVSALTGAAKPRV